jgi:phosphoribulokinase
MESLEATTAKHNATLLSDVKGRLDIIDSIGLENLPSFISDTTERFQKLEEATATLTIAVRSLIEDVATTPQPAATEIEFAKPPAAIPDSPVQTADIAAVASACLTMNDVLMICRALRDSPDTELMDKNEILNIACRSAGVEVTHGLQIRAGVHDTGA